MNPIYPNAPISAEDVPLQGTPQPMYPGQLHTTTAAGGHNTIVLQAEPPRDHIIWSLCCFLYSNPLCLGLAALIFSIKVTLFKIKITKCCTEIWEKINIKNSFRYGEIKPSTHMKQ
uniref:Uncharacterized protein n=1 Tax=Oryzias sinensis TaxID=183150 RepID=A0A8C7Y8I7_9TELE